MALNEAANNARDRPDHERVPRDYANSIDRAMTAMYAGKDIKSGLDDAAKEWDAITNKLGVDKQRESYAQFLKLPGATAQEHGRQAGARQSRSASASAAAWRLAPRRAAGRRRCTGRLLLDGPAHPLAARRAVGPAHPRPDDLPARLRDLGELRPVRLLRRPTSIPWVGLDNFKDGLGRPGLRGTPSG